MSVSTHMCTQELTLTCVLCVAKGKEPKITLVDGSTMSDSHQVNKSDGSVGVIAGSAVAVIVCMIIVIIMVVIFLRK